jgi:hypothetical protein
LLISLAINHQFVAVDSLYAGRWWAGKGGAVFCHKP